MSYRPVQKEKKATNYRYGPRNQLPAKGVNNPFGTRISLLVSIFSVCGQITDWWF